MDIPIFMVEDMRYTIHEIQQLTGMKVFKTTDIKLLLLTVDTHHFDQYCLPR